MKLLERDVAYLWGMLDAAKQAASTLENDPTRWWFQLDHFQGNREVVDILSPDGTADAGSG